MRLRIKNTNLTLKMIGWLQILGGIVGLGIMAYIMYETGTITGVILLLILIGIGLFSFSIYSGKRIVTELQSLKGIIYP